MNHAHQETGGVLAQEPAGRPEPEPAAAAAAESPAPAAAATSISPAPPTPAASRRRASPASTAGLLAILIKEFAHMRREPSTLFFMLVIPVLQTLIFGYAIRTQVEDIRTVIYDLDGRTAGRELIDRFRNTRTFRVVAQVNSQEELQRSLLSGQAQVAIIIPPDYSPQLLHGEQATVQVLVDGSDSQVASTALNGAKLLGVQFSIELAQRKAQALQVAAARDPSGRPALPMEVRPRLLYNPDLRSSAFFVPGLVGIILQLVTLFLSSFAIVREREQGTLEQLFVTPVGRAGLLLGKLFPYAIVGFVETMIVLTVMVYVFVIPIRGSIFDLMLLSALFLFCSLGLGLLVSTVARTQLQAIQLAFVIMMVTVLLSGFMFPRDQMPLPIYVVTFAIPATYFLQMLRGLVLRGAGLENLVPQILGLSLCAITVLSLSIARFRKNLG